VGHRRTGSVLATIVAMLAASLALHLILWPLGDQILALEWGAPSLPQQGGVMEVALLPSAADPDEEEPDPEETPDVEPPVDPEGRVVELDRLQDERPPEESDFLSEFDSRVDQQTKAPTGRARPGDPGAQPGDRPDASSSQQHQPSSSTAQALSLGQRMGTEAPEGSDQGMTSPSSEPGASQAQRDSRSIAGLRGSSSTLHRALGSQGSYDDLREIEEGDETLLNSRRWRFASFFNRLRDAVAQHWHPETLHAARDPDGRVSGTKTRITRLRIRLNPDGSLSRVLVEQPCGVDYLDEEAIRAVRAAQPFNNPPPQLVDPATGYIEFGFGFIFEIHGRGRIFRYSR
jgi:TonB family protein